ncbi:M48 family metalloprotease [Thiomicrospira microaerophila]|uniref:M48 family metalloprotease n=1 Tax=Thiomicrospira microaerophila TaxID=406020 RepID=UPI0006962F6F|nr:M48 family metalloprotease [Thiomicrospira microaerophila]
MKYLFNRKLILALSVALTSNIALSNPAWSNETTDGFDVNTLIESSLNTALIEKQLSFRQRAFTDIVEPEYTADDIQAEIIFGRELASKILGRYPVLRDDKLNDYVSHVGHTLAQFSQRPELTYYFIVLNTDEINAYAAPGGYVFITKGALNKAQNEAQLAAILAHEMGHIEARHYVRAIGLRGTNANADNSLTAILSGGGNAAVVAFNQAVSQAMEILFEKGLQSKQDEFEADAASVWLLVNAGYQPSALADYFVMLSGTPNNQTQVLSNTHPPMNERITELQNILNEHGLDGLRLATLEERLNEHR